MTARRWSPRLLTEADAETFRRTRLAALRTDPEVFGSTHEVEAARPLEAFARRLAGSIVWSAVAGAEMIGMIGCEPETSARESHKGFVWGAYVDPAWRGQGVGGALLAALIDTARERVEQLKLTVVVGSPAIRLYERFGFVTYGLEPRSLRLGDGFVDEVLMARALGPAVSCSHQRFRRS